MQDIPVFASSTTRTLFDNGSELTLVSSIFAKKNNLPYEEATYTLAGVGGAEKTYHAGKGGRVYTVPLMSSSGEQINVKALSVEVILPGKKGREKLNLNPKKFPHIPVRNLKEAEKCLPRKHLDLLIGNSDLGLQPACTAGFGCTNCARNQCLYRSKFACGWVPLGSFKDNKAKDSTLKYVAHTQLVQPLEQTFLQEGS